MKGRPQVGTTNNMRALLELKDSRYRGNVVGLWACECGATKELPISRVKSNSAKSCGCLKTKHGEGGMRSPEYTAWQAMHARCSTSSNDADRYAARGIGVCQRWKDFSLFLADMGRKPTPQHSLGRIDNDQGYSPENCRWESAAEQMRNTSVSMLWTVRGETFPSCRAAAARFGVDHKTIRYWVKTAKEGCHATSRY